MSLRAGTRDSACTRAWNFAADTVTGDITLYAKWKDNRFVELTLSGLTTPMNDPTGIAVDNAGRIYVADKNNSRVLVFNASGALTAEWTSIGVSLGYFAAQPTGIAFSKVTGHIYITNGVHEVIELDTSGNIVRGWGGFGANGGGKFRITNRIGINAQGEVFVTDDFYGYIEKFTSSGAFLKDWPAKDYTNAGIALSGGKIYVSDLGSGMIRVYNETDKTYSALTPSGVSLGEPAGMAFDGEGNLYLADKAEEYNRIIQMDTAGNVLGIWGAYGTGNNQVNAPRDITVGADGTVYALDSGNNRIMVKRP